MTPAILACRAGDVAVLERLNPSPSVTSFHAQRFARHQSGASTYVVAWHNRVPVGRAEIKWDGCDDAPVRHAYPGCPEINGLEVFPDRLRGNGIGSALIARAETLAAARGVAHIGVGVADDNPDAARLYRRLGYHETVAYTDRYACLDSRGTWHHFADACVFSVKTLPRHRSPHVVKALLVRLCAVISGHRPLASRHM